MLRKDFVLTGIVMREIDAVDPGIHKEIIMWSVCASGLLGQCLVIDWLVWKAKHEVIDDAAVEVV